MRIFSRKTLLILAPFAAILLGIGLYLTQPWRYFTSSYIDEGLPGVSAQATPGNSESGTNIATGTFTSLDHETSGSARLVKLADGSHIIRFENLASLDGPDLHVVATSATGDFSDIRSANYLNLGELKATHGNQNYVIPAGTDLSTIKSIVIWCDRFSSPFGAATLAPASSTS